MNFQSDKKQQAFTIVELLVVIVVIGILAAITIVSYSGIQNRAILASLKSDLSNDATLLKMYYAEYGYYPSTLDGSSCPATPKIDSNYCLKTSSGNSLSYIGGGQGFKMVATKGNNSWQAIEYSGPVDPNFIIIGMQSWSKTNLNVGTLVANDVNQTNNSTLEKYCYDNNEANCTTYGGFYQWDEAMQYVNTEGAQGICPAGSHIPSDNDWKQLEMQLGMSQTSADATGWRGTDQSTQLRPGGSSGMESLLSGFRSNDTLFYNITSRTNFWTSSESGANAWKRTLFSFIATVERSAGDKLFGYSVRCIKN